MSFVTVASVPAALPPLEVSAAQRGALERLLRAPSTAQQTVLRAQIVLAANTGQPSRQIATQLGVSEPTVKLWRRSFAERGLEGLADRLARAVRGSTTTSRSRGWGGRKDA